MLTNEEKDIRKKKKKKKDDGGGGEATLSFFFSLFPLISSGEHTPSFPPVCRSLSLTLA
jgi:hypothetical protein